MESGTTLCKPAQNNSGLLRPCTVTAGAHPEGGGGGGGGCGVAPPPPPKVMRADVRKVHCQLRIMQALVCSAATPSPRSAALKPIHCAIATFERTSSDI